MDTMPPVRFKPRSPQAALWLSFFAAGVGHVYCGRFGKGLLLFFLSLVGQVFGAFWFMGEGRGGSFQTATLAMLVLSVLVWLYAMLDARAIARRTAADYVLKDYNRGYVYVLLALVPSLVSIGLAFHVRANLLQAMVAANDSMAPTIRKGERVLVFKQAYRVDPPARGDVVVFPHPNRRNVNHVKRIVALPGDALEIGDDDWELILGHNMPSSLDGRGWRSASRPNPAAGRTPNYIVRLHSPAGEPVAIKPGDKVERRDDCLLVNGRPLQVELIDGSLQAFWDAWKGRPSATSRPAGLTVPNGHCFVLGDNRADSEDSRAFGPVPLSDILGRVDYIYFPRWASLRKEAPR